MIEAAETALRDGRTQWRREAAARVAFLVDGAAYFAAADRHGRRRILCPVVLGAKEEDDGWVRVHGKALVVDDRLVRVGSANLSNRSMDVDTECDLAVRLGVDEEHR
jgi:PLD-like domain